jgi:hypothetical protein
MVNLTVENGALRRLDGPEIRDLRVALDYGPLELQVREASFQIGQSSVKLKARVQNPRTRPQVSVSLVSERLDIAPSRNLPVPEEVA